jgi:predicted DNA-binding transcriptional regulator AlpA
MIQKPSAEYLAPGDQARRLGISRTTFDRLAKHPAFPKPLRVMARPLFRSADVDLALFAISAENERERPSQ